MELLQLAKKYKQLLEFIDDAQTQIFMMSGEEVEIEYDNLLISDINVTELLNEITLQFGVI